MSPGIRCRVWEEVGAYGKDLVIAEYRKQSQEYKEGGMEPGLSFATRNYK